MSIIVKHISKKYGAQYALKGIKLSIHPGEIVGLIGPNGAGKTTLMKIICGTIPADEGTVKVLDKDMADDSIQIRKKLGYLPENNPLYTEMYIKEYLDYVAGLYALGKEKRSRIEEVIKLTGLEPEKNKKIGALSKGFRQRVGIAQALIHNPEILILDEPTSGLDPNQIIEIRNLIARIGKEKTVILSTHLMQEVEAICDRVIILNKGEVVADDKPQQIKSKSTPAAKYQTVILELAQETEQFVFTAIPEITEIKAINTTTWVIQSSGKTDIRSKLFDLAVANKLTVLSMQNKNKSLEEVFQELTAK